MTLPIEAAQIAAAAGILFTGGALQGVAGFGMGLIAIPVMIRALPRESVVPVMTGLAWVMNAQMFFKLRRDADLRVIAIFLAGAFVGTQLGMYIPALVPAHAFRLGVGVLICLSGAAIYCGWQVSLRSTAARLAVGALSGALGASISLSGPPVAIFMTAGGVPKNVFRASTALYFLLLNTVTLVTFAARDELGANFFPLLGWLLPPLVLGTYLGIRGGSRVPEKPFRLAVIALILLSGVSLLF